MGNENKLNLTELRYLLGERIRRLCDEKVPPVEKKREHDINLDIALLSKNFLNAYDMEIRLRRVKLDNNVIEGQVTAIEQPKDN